MLTGLEFWHLVSHIIPVYVIVLFGYASVRIGLLLPPHLPGLSRFVSMIGVPVYAFYLLAFNDPYKTSFKLVGADVLQKACALTVGCLWWRFAPTGSIDNLINFFMLATLPNTVLIAESLLQPLYGDEALGKIVTIILLQCFVWYNLCIAMYELRNVLLEEAAAERKVKDGELELSQHKAEQHSARKSGISIIVTDGSERHHDIDLSDSKRASQRFSCAPDVITRTSSAPPGIAALGKVFPALSQEQAGAQAESNEDSLTKALSRTTAEIKAASARNSNVDGDRAENMTSAAELAARNRPRDEPPLSNCAVKTTDVEALEPSPPRKHRATSLSFAGRVLVKAANRLKYAPLIYGSVIGFIYSLISFKYDWTMPYSILTSIELIANGAVGAALFLLGTSWASSGKLILCGYRRMLWGMFLRFIISPFIMIATSLIVGLKGDAYRFAVIQAVIPQGIISFVFAKEYGLQAEEFATATIAQLLIFVPIAIVYYIVLDSV